MRLANDCLLFNVWSSVNFGCCVLRLLGLFAEIDAPSETEVRWVEYGNAPFAMPGRFDWSDVAFLSGGFRNVEPEAIALC